jgi:hypothetical protein
VAATWPSKQVNRSCNRDALHQLVHPQHLTVSPSEGHKPLLEKVVRVLEAR